MSDRWIRLTLEFVNEEMDELIKHGTSVIYGGSGLAEFADAVGVLAANTIRGEWGDDEAV